MPTRAPCRLLTLLVGLAGLLAACTNGGDGGAADPAATPRDALRVTMAGFDGGPGFTLPTTWAAARWC